MTDESPKEEILINVTPREVRAALLENGILQEVTIERAARRGLISNIYKGKVSRVLPGMQAAFIDIGLERTAFLHASDISRSNAPLNGNGNGDGDNDVADIRELVREGQDVLVDGVSQGAIRSYTFEKVNADHTISAEFDKGDYIVNLPVVMATTK